MRDILKPLLPLSMVLLPSAAFSEPPSIETLLENCADKTVVYMMDDASGELIKKGEKIDGYCAGFLEGVLAALEHEKLVCPDWEKDKITPTSCSQCSTITQKKNRLRVSMQVSL